MQRPHQHLPDAARRIRDANVQASSVARMAIRESITQEAWTEIYWTMVLVEGILVVHRISRVDPTLSSNSFVLRRVLQSRVS